jgi:hypothetical protein
MIIKIARRKKTFTEIFMKENISTETILALLAESLPEAERQTLLAALRKDEALRRELAGHVAFKTMMQMSAIEPAAGSAVGAHVDDETLGAFLETRLAADEAESVRSHLRACNDCFLRMAALSKAFAEKERLEMPPTPADFVAKAKQLLPAPEEVVAEAKDLPVAPPAGIGQAIAELWKKIKHWLEPVPAWGYGLAGVAAAVILFMLFLPGPPVENFSLGNRLVIFDNGPLGFVNEGETVEYSGMSVALSEEGEQLIFTWPEVPEALFYEITLIEAGQRRTITPLGGALENTFAFPTREVKPGARYVWELSGRRKDKKNFMAKAGFALKW